MSAVACSIVQGQPKAPAFHPCLWGDFFLTHQLPTAHQRAHMTKRAEVLKQEVRKIVKATKETPRMLDLVMTLQRLGLDNHYEHEIDEMLQIVYNSSYDENNLNLVSLRFYLLRSNGYDVSSDVFLNFRNAEGTFAAHDTRDLLSLYNAAYLRTHGEKVLDEAIIFTRARLEAALNSLDLTLANEVSLALQTPLFRRVRILEARRYIPIYEKEAARNEVILEFAKVNFNLLQILYCKELGNVTMWWKELNMESNSSFIRDRIVETHFWMAGACSEHQYSLSRVILTKMMAYITIIDDIFDTYATTEDSMQLAEAIYRWNERAVQILPNYMKDFYLHLLKTIDSFSDELGPNKSYRLFYLKEVLKRLVRGYCQEIKWRDEKYVPKTIREHLEVTRETIGTSALLCSYCVGMGDMVTKEVLDWLLTYPELLKCLGTFSRLTNDIATTKREQIRGHHASTVQCYMLQHGTTMQDACEKIKELIEDSWKDMMKLNVAPAEQHKVVARAVVDMARTGDYIYKGTADAFTFSHSTKDIITRLYLEPIPF